MQVREKFFKNVAIFLHAQLYAKYLIKYMVHVYQHFVHCQKVQSACTHLSCSITKVTESSSELSTNRAVTYM